MFGVLFLALDLLVLGYLLGPKTCARVYNFGHTYVTPLLICTVGNVANIPWFVLICTIWVAHMGFDRLLGYGLKYDTPRLTILTLEGCECLLDCA